jgi:hypothetical protein
MEAVMCDLPEERIYLEFDEVTAYAREIPVRDEKWI